MGYPHFTTECEEHWPVLKRPVLAEVDAERQRQDRLWGQQDHPDVLVEPLGDGAAPGLTFPMSAPRAYYRAQADYWKKINAARVAYLNAQGRPTGRNCAWDGILLEEVFEALAEVEGDDPALRAELVQAAAVATAWVEAIDRRRS